MRCIAARLLLIFFIYLCLSFGVCGSLSIWLSLSVGLSVVVHPLFFYCVCLLFLVFTCAQFINPLCTPCVYQLHTYLYQRDYFGFLYLEWTRMSVVLMVLLSFSAVFFFSFCLLYSSSSSSSPSSSFSTVSQHHRWILWPIFLVAWLLYATLRCWIFFINEYVFGWFICVASDG